MTAKNPLIQYTITTTEKPDEDGRYILTFKVNWQESKQVATHIVDLVYKAKNGYTIISGMGVALFSKTKKIYLLGSMEHGQLFLQSGKLVPADIDFETFESKKEMETFKKDIIEAINDWAENGGFDTSHLRQETHEA